MPGPLLAVSRTETNQVTILELGDREEEFATIRVNSKQPFGLAFDETRRWLYAACWTGGKIAAINLSSCREERSLCAARLPAWSTPRAGTNEVWFSNEGAGIVSVLDTTRWSVSGEIATGAGPSDIAFTDNGRYAWVTNEKDDSVSLIDAHAYRRIRDIPVGKIPQGIAVAEDGRRLLVANFGSNSVSVVDTRSRKELTQIGVGRGPVDIAISHHKEREYAWVTCFSEGVVSIVDIERREYTERVVTGGKPQGIEAHPMGDRIYVAVRKSNEVVVLDSSAPPSILRRIKMDGGPARMAIAP